MIGRTVFCKAVGFGAVATSRPCLAAEAGGVNPLPLDVDLAIVTLVVFLLVLAVLWRFAWGPILEGLAKREQGIADEIDSAKKNHEDARALLAEYQRQLDSARDEVRQMIESGKKTAERQQQQIVAGARQAAAAERDRALREIGAAKNEAIRELAKGSIDTAVDLAGKIVGRQLSPDDHSRLVHEALEKFPSKN